MERFENAVAIVTGGGMGLGEALCEELGRRGATVVVADIDGDAARAVAGRLAQAGRSAVAVPVDVANQIEVARLIENTVAEYGRVDYMINNAGIAIGGILATFRCSSGVASSMSTCWAWCMGRCTRISSWRARAMGTSSISRRSVGWFPSQAMLRTARASMGSSGFRFRCGLRERTLG